jgi:septum formation protein
MEKIILATTSPYRKEIFESLGIPFEVASSDVDESKVERSNPEDLVKTLAIMKASAVADKYNEAIILGFDSVGYFEGEILEKPKSKGEAFLRLKKLSGKKHQHYTGIYGINTKTKRNSFRVEKNEIYMREYTEEEIKDYLKQDEKISTYALGYDTERHISASFIEKIEGNHLNLKGIPLSAVMEIIKEISSK